MALPQVCRFLLPDCALLAALLVLAQCCPHLGLDVTQRGFFCDDATLRYPYRDSTVSTAALYLIGFYLPLLVMVSAELLCLLFIRWQRRKNGASANAAQSEGAKLLELYQVASAFLLGYGCERFFKAVAKSTVGRLRPHFFAVCQPQTPDGSSCDDPQLAGRYIEDYTCLGVNATDSMLKNAHLSFPSGHSSLSFYGMVFLAFYLQRCMSGRQPAVRVLKPLLQLACLLVAWYVALSRVMDYKHHWSDALAGAVLGTAVAVFVALNLERGWCRQRTEQQQQEQQQQQELRQFVACTCGQALAPNEALTEVKSMPQS